MAEQAQLIVLVVDDDASLRDSVAFDIQMLGHMTLQAENGNKAMAILTSSKVDLVVSDIRMPEADGVQLLKRLRETMGPFPPLAFMTGFADIPIWEAFDLGAEAYFGKPFSSELLEALVKDLTTKEDQKWSRSDLTATHCIEVHYRKGANEGFAIGRGGIFLGGERGDLLKGSVVQFKVTQDGMPGAIEGVGIVRWQRAERREDLPPGCGIEFKYIEPALRAKLIRMVKASGIIAFIPMQHTIKYKAPIG